MEISPLTLISITFPIVVAAIGFVVWLIRLEGRHNQNEKTLIRLETDSSDLWKVIEEHRLNADIHFNLRVSSQVEQSNERRFQTIENQLKEINQKLDRMAEKH